MNKMKILALVIAGLFASSLSINSTSEAAVIEIRPKNIPGTSDSLENALLYQRDPALRSEALRFSLASEFLNQELKPVISTIVKDRQATEAAIQKDRWVANTFLLPAAVAAFGGVVLLADGMRGGDFANTCSKGLKFLSTKAMLLGAFVGLGTTGVGVSKHISISSRIEAGEYDRRFQTLNGTELNAIITNLVNDLVIMMGWEEADSRIAMGVDKNLLLQASILQQVLNRSTRNSAQRIDLLSVMKSDNLLYQYENPMVLQRTRRILNLAGNISDFVGLSEKEMPTKKRLQKNAAEFESILNDASKRITHANTSDGSKAKALSAIQILKNKVEVIKQKYGA